LLVTRKKVHRPDFRIYDDMMMTDPDDTRPCARFLHHPRAGPGSRAGTAGRLAIPFIACSDENATPLAFEIQRLASTLAVVAPGDGFDSITKGN
jgi:hypothetical protein